MHYLRLVGRLAVSAIAIIGGSGVSMFTIFARKENGICVDMEDVGRGTE